MAAAISALSLSAVAVGLASAPSASASPTHNPIGHLDSVTRTAPDSVTVKGWAVDRDRPTSRVTIDVRVDGRLAARNVTTVARPDVARLLHVGPAAGFTATVRTGYGTHTVCVYADNIGPGATSSLGCVKRNLTDPNNPVGVTSIRQSGPAVTVTGWTFDPNASATPISVLVTEDGHRMLALRASQPDGAVNTRYRIRGGHGFTGRLAVRPGRHTICVTALNVRAGSANPLLGCGTATVAAPVNLNQRIVSQAARYVGYRYVEGGASPRTGFDCSGLTSYVYATAARISLPHNAETQARLARALPRSRALPGDLVFFHDGSGYVFHVAVYAGRNMIYSAATPKDGVRYQPIWSNQVSFGTFTHV